MVNTKSENIMRKFFVLGKFFSNKQSETCTVKINGAVVYTGPFDSVDPLSAYSPTPNIELHPVVQFDAEQPVPASVSLQIEISGGVMVFSMLGTEPRFLDENGQTQQTSGIVELEYPDSQSQLYAVMDPMVDGHPHIRDASDRPNNDLRGWHFHFGQSFSCTYNLVLPAGYV